MPSYILRPPLLWRKAICSAKQGDRWSASTNNLIQNMLKTNPKNMQLHNHMNLVLLSQYARLHAPFHVMNIILCHFMQENTVIGNAIVGNG
jgi:hypothetical protein